MAMKQGTIIDTTLIAAPSSTKNKEGKRDPEMHQTKKGNQWYFGLKVHIGVDKDTGLIHSVETTAANVHDTQAADLLHGEEKVVYADAGYRGIEKREEWRVSQSSFAWPCGQPNAELCQIRMRAGFRIWWKELKSISVPRLSIPFG